MRDGEDLEIVHIQTVLPKSVIDELKLKTHKTNIKDAVAKAVYFYLNSKEVKK